MGSSERRSFSSSTGSTAVASSSYSSGSSATPTTAAAGVELGRFFGGADWMVKEELEAAEALADLAHLAMRESNGAESAGNWGQKGKRAKKRVKSESPPSLSGLKPVVPAPSCPDPPQDQLVTDLQQCKTVCPDVLTEPVKTEEFLSKKIVKAEHDAELTKLSSVCTTSYQSFSCSKSRRNLTEEEREERRIRRILANRESARQTIRRRQALCEDLTRKAADLALENENLKLKKESALKEYQSLEKTNKHLKVEMSKVIKADVEDTPVDNMSTYMHVPTSSPTNSQLFLFNRPRFTPLFWPPIIQSSDSIQLQQASQLPTAISSNIPLAANGTTDSSHEQENSVNSNGTGTPVYVIPCPWFFPHFDNGNGLQPRSSCQRNNQEEISYNNQPSGSSSSTTVPQLDNHSCSLPVRLKSEASVSVEARLSNDLNQTPPQFTVDGSDQHTGAHPNENVCKEILLASGYHARVASSNGFGSDYTTTGNTYHAFSALPEKKSGSIIFASKKQADIIAATEARKRRKKLTKLKNLHGRQCRTQC